MLDENAFGILLSYHHAENDEYACEPPEFAERFTRFRKLVADFLDENPLGNDVVVVDLGHAVYLEVAHDDETVEPLGWLRQARARLAEHDFVSVGVLSHGSRWVDESEGPSVSVEHVAGVRRVALAGPSEPLRRALYAETASHRDEDDAPEGWGPGLYADTEAIEALGKQPKNAPTLLRVAGASFYRAGR